MAGARGRRLAARDWRAAILLLFFTRSVFQWPFLLVAAASLLLLGMSWRRLAVLVAAVGLVMGAYVAKQHALFGITFTSSFAADNFCKGLHEYCPGVTDVGACRAARPREGARALAHGQARRRVQLQPGRVPAPVVLADGGVPRAAAHAHLAAERATRYAGT